VWAAGGELVDDGERP
jgi:multiple sugar transport system substrate-binding protein